LEKKYPQGNSIDTTTLKIIEYGQKIHKIEEKLKKRNKIMSVMEVVK
jgi:hypothetical protein